VLRLLAADSHWLFKAVSIKENSAKPPHTKMRPRLTSWFLI